MSRPAVRPPDADHSSAAVAPVLPEPPGGVAAPIAGPVGIALVDRPAPPAPAALSAPAPSRGRHAAPEQPAPEEFPPVDLDPDPTRVGPATADDRPEPGGRDDDPDPDSATAAPAARTAPIGGAPGPADRAAPPRTIRQSIRQVTDHLRPVRTAGVVALALLVLAALVGLGQPIATQWILQALAAGSSLGTPVLLLVLCVLVSAAAQGGGQFLMLRVAEDVVAGTRIAMVQRMLGMSVAAMARRDPGDLMSRVVADSSSVRQIALQSLVQSVTGTVVVVGSVIMMLWLDWFLFCITFAVVISLCAALTLVMPRIRAAAQLTQATVGEVNNELERALGSFTTVKASGAQATEERRIGATVRRARNFGVRAARWSAVSAMTSALTVQAAFLVVLAVGALRVQSGDLTVATLVAFLLYAMQLSAPVLQLTAAVSSFQSGRAALDRIAQTETFEQEDDFDAPGVPAEAVPGARNRLGATSWDPAVVLEDVCFGYPDTATPTLQGVSLTIPATGLTALVGPSGSGKSTVLRLVEGFYPLDSGRLVVGGRVLGDWDLDRLRDEVAYVEQETPVLAGTIAENLQYGLDDPARPERMAEVLARTGLDQRIESVEDRVGHRGNDFSGGERQRISIARALLRQPRLLLLDEVTSQLDPRTESSMKELIAEISERIPVVMVAHRLSTVLQADQIVVLESGRVRAVGDHASLMAQDALYRQMVTQQGLAAAE